MFDKSDPRATLTMANKKAELTEVVGAEYGKFYESAPNETDDSSKTWWMRGRISLLLTLMQPMDNRV